MPGKSRARQIVEQELREAAQVALATTQSRYCKAFDRRAHGYALLGHTNEEIGELIGVSRSAIDTWLVEHPSFKAAIQKARVDDHIRLVKSMHRAGNGFKARETKVFQHEGRLQTIDIVKHYPPSVQAASLILMNRDGARWRDVKSVEHSGQVNLSHLVESSLGELAKPVDAKVIEPESDD